MRKLNRRGAAVFLGLLLLLGAVVAGGASSGAADAGGGFSPWTSSGSSGTVDEADLAEVEFGPTLARIKSSVPSGQVVMRYNVVDTGGLSSEGVFLQHRYTDNGPGAQVVSRLFQMNTNTGVFTQRLLFDSNAFAQSPSPQQQAVFNCAGGFDFNNNVYFVVVQLNRTASTGDPTLYSARVGFTIC